MWFFEMGSQYQLISDLNAHTDGLKFKGSVVLLWKQHVYLNLYELNSIDIILMNEKVSIYHG